MQNLEEPRPVADQSDHGGVLIDKIDHTLCPNGTVTLHIQSHTSGAWKSFVVSPEVLMLASQVFTTLFGGEMQEAREVKNDKNARIELLEDDADAMDIILRVLHHDCPDIHTGWSLELLASVAVHCDKYACHHILSPRVMEWLSHIPSSNEGAHSYGLRLLITFNLRASAHFSKIFAEASGSLTPGFAAEWKRHALLQLLPRGIASELLTRIKDMSNAIQGRIESVEGNLRKQGSMHLMQHMECCLCGRKHPQDAKKCHPCNNTQLRGRFCSEETRVADFYSALMQACVLGANGDFHPPSIAEFVTRVTSANRDLKHTCAADLNCPLRKEMQALSRACQQIRDNATGTTPEEIRRDAQSDTILC